MEQYRPAGHGPEHAGEERPGEDPYVPAGHGRRMPSKQYVPAGQVAYPSSNTIVGGRLGKDG